MPSARAHDIITIYSAVALAPLAHVVQPGIIASADRFAHTTLFAFGHLLSGLLFSPDLDIDSEIDNRWGPLFWIWRPYMRLIPHRSFWSHSLVVSPLLRLLYFYGIVMIFAVVIQWILNQAGITAQGYALAITNFLRSLAETYPGFSLAFVLGFITGSAAHSIADWLVTHGRPYLPRMGVRLLRDYTDHDRQRHRRRRRV